MSIEKYLPLAHQHIRSNTIKEIKKTYCFMHSGMPTYSMGTSSASSAKLKTYLIFWLNFEL